MSWWRRGGAVCRPAVSLRSDGISGGKCDTCGHIVAQKDTLGGHRMTPSGRWRRDIYNPQVSNMDSPAISQWIWPPEMPQLANTEGYRSDLIKIVCKK